MKPSFPLGVDILEWKKAKSFYERHSRRLDAWFSPDERRFVESKRKPHEAFAMIFAAKEAAFKAVGKECRVVPLPGGRFQVSGRKNLKITVRRHRRHVVACCVRAA